MTPQALTSGISGDTCGGGRAPAGDINGDGYADVIVCAPHADFFVAGCGAAYVYLGGPNGVSLTPAWTAFGGQAGSQFGFSVAGVGDVNDDGYDDVLVGEPFWDEILGATDAGRVQLFLGSATGLAPTPAWTKAFTVGAFGGYSVSGGGDLKGDNVADFAIGVPGGSGPGNAWVFYGVAGGLPGVGSNTAETCFQASAFFGGSVDLGGDVNGDGYADLLVGASGYDDLVLYHSILPAGNTVRTPLIDICYGGPSAPGAPLVTLSGFAAPPGPVFDTRIQSAGDVDGDGHADLTWVENHVLPGNQVSYLLYLSRGGTTGQHAPMVIDSTLTSTSQPEELTAGDVDGDGLTDIVTGHPSRSAGHGSINLYRSGAGGPPRSVWNLVSNTTHVLGQRGRSDSPTIVAAGSVLRSAAGRVRLRGRLQVIPEGTPFSNVAGTIGVCATPLSGASQLMGLRTLGLNPGTAYHLRMRTESTNPRHRFGRWLSPTVDGWGGYDVRTSGGNVAVEASVTGAALRLAQAWPNPSRGEVHLAFTLPAADHVRSDIYDAAGRRVGTLLDRTLLPGRHEIAWDGRGADGSRVRAGEATMRCVRID